MSNEVNDDDLFAAGVHPHTKLPVHVTLVSIDTCGRMREPLPYSDSNIGRSDSPPAYYYALLCVLDALKLLVSKRRNDRVAVVVDGVNILHPLESPTAESIQQLQTKIEQCDEWISKDDSSNSNTAMNMNGFGMMVSKCQPIIQKNVHLFNFDRQLSLGVVSRRILFITSDLIPNMSDNVHQYANSIILRTLSSTGVGVEILPVAPAGDSTVNNGDSNSAGLDLLDQLSLSILKSSSNNGSDDNAYPTIHLPSSFGHDLLGLFMARIFPSRPEFESRLTISGDISLPIVVFRTAGKSTLPTPAHVIPTSPANTTTDQRRVSSVSGAHIQPRGNVRYERVFREIRHVDVSNGTPVDYSEGSDYLKVFMGKVGDLQALFTAEEQNKIQSAFGECGIKLIGFKSTKSLQPYHNIGASYFITLGLPHSSANDIDSDSNKQQPQRDNRRTRNPRQLQLFEGLRKRMLKLGAIAICLMVLERSHPRIVALIPQNESIEHIDNNGDTDGKSGETNISCSDPHGHPLGFHMILLPFSDEMRVPQAALRDNNRISRDDIPDDAVSSCIDLVNKLHVGRGFDPAAYPNPIQARRNELLRLIVTSENSGSGDDKNNSDNKGDTLQSEPAYLDSTLPKYNGIHKRVGPLIQTIKQSLHIDDVNPIKAAIAIENAVDVDSTEHDQDGTSTTTHGRGKKRVRANSSAGEHGSGRGRGRGRGRTAATGH